jgi:hypothetical protein
MKMWAWMVLSLAGVVASATAQTTQPAPQAWDQTVQAAAKSLSSSDDCRHFICDDCVLRSFETSSPRQIDDVVAHTNGASLLMAKAYVFPGTTIATDMAQAVTDTQVPDEVKKLLVPGDADAAAKANLTAQRWVQNSLGAATGDAVAVLVFFTGQVTQSTTTDGQVFFVMLKGRPDSSGSYLISHIVYGDSQQAAVTSAR